MDPEVKKQLEEIHALVKDNHRIVKDVRRHQLISAYGKVVIWLIVLASTLYFYQVYLRPQIDAFQADKSGQHPSSFFGFPTFADMQKLINSYKAKQ